MAQLISLNNDWKYSGNFCHEMTQNSYLEEGMETVRLPHCNIETPFHYFDEALYQFISCYRRRIDVKKEWKGKQVLLTFEGVGHIATVYLNGEKITTHYGGYTSFTVDLEPFLRFPITENDLSQQFEADGITSQPAEAEWENILVVEVDSRESNNLPPFGNVIDYLTYGGIYREVYLEIKEQYSFEDVFLMTKDGKLTKQKEQEVELQIKLHLPKKTEQLYVNVIVTDEDNQSLYSEVIQASDQSLLHRFKIAGVKSWDIEEPNLYHLKLILYRQDCNKVAGVGNHENEKLMEEKLYNRIILDEKSVRFGFRTCEFKEDGFYLNHRKIKLVGLNRHQSYPYVGYAMPKRMQQRDTEILKNELHVNAVRTSHYPQSKHFINRCDELGLLVFTEIPGWQHIGDENWKQIACEQVKEMVLQYRNHPSIILWGVRINESQDDDAFYTRTNAIAHELDPSRQTGGVRYLKKSSLLEDVYTYNDFSHNGATKGLDLKKDVTSNRKAPYLVTEYNGHMFPAKSFDSEEHRLQHALRHACVLDAAFRQNDLSGVFGWCMFDYNTHKDFGSGDRICYHGVMDMFRNPKMAATVYASQNEEEHQLEVSSSLDIGDHPAGDIGKVYVFTNADYIRLYKNDSFIKEFYPDQMNYPGLPHPPVIVDDFVGDLLEQKEGFRHKTAEEIKKLLFAVKKYGPSNLPLKYKLKMVILMLKEKLKMEDAARLYYEYIGSWGGVATVFRFEAVKNAEVVKVVHKKPSNQPILRAAAGTTILKEGDTYDVTEVRLQMVDEYGNRLPYYQEPVIFETWGVIDLIGPKTLSLKGGMAGTYVRTMGKKGEGGLRIKQEHLGTTELIFTVQ